MVRPQQPSRGWGIDRHYSNIIGNERISYKGSLSDAYDDSKIIVCSYPETTFFEALYSGKPTILLYMKENWDFHSEFSSLISIMEDANILFTNPVAASNHINKIWDNPDYWWNLPKVVNAREEFFDQCGRVDDNWLDQWGDFFKEQLIN
jgi:putative transferase (TIGR04331 family)